jgi:hypothetical protein
VSTIGDMVTIGSPRSSSEIRNRACPLFNRCR